MLKDGAPLKSQHGQKVQLRVAQCDKRVLLETIKFIIADTSAMTN